MDWEKAELRHEPRSIEARIFHGIREIVRARKRTPHLHSAYTSVILRDGNPHLFAYARPHPLGDLVAIYNFSEHHQQFDASLLA